MSAPYYVTASRAELRASYLRHQQQSSKCFLGCIMGNDTLSEYIEHQKKVQPTEAKWIIVRGILFFKFYCGATFWLQT